MKCFYWKAYQNSQRTQISYIVRRYFPNNNYVVSGSFDKEVKIWDLSTGTLITTLKSHQKEFSSVAISPDNKYIVSGSNDKAIKIWKFESQNS